MKRSRKSNRVSWAPAAYLCQMKLFLSEDSPSKVSMPAQEHFSRKSSQTLEHLRGQKAVDIPPGFESILKLRKVNQEAYRIPKIEWSCPPRFVMRGEWRVAAGEESNESSAQKLREMGVLEAIYPRRSTVPHSPSFSSEAAAEHCDDSLTPLVPLIPIEEEDTADIEANPSEPSNPPVFSQTSQPPVKPSSSGSHDRVPVPPASRNTVSSSGADVVTAASTALVALLKSKEPSSLIDTGLLVKIFSDPEMIKNLINSSHSANPTTPPVFDLVPPQSAKPATPSAPVAADDKFHEAYSRTKLTSIPGMASVSASIPVPTVSTPLPAPSNGSSQILHRGTKPTLQPYTIPVPESNPVATSFPMPARQVSENFPNPSMVQPASVDIPTQSNIPPKSPPFSLRPYPSPNLQLPFSSGMPPQPSSVFHAHREAEKSDTVKDMNYIKNLIREHGADRQQKQFGIHNHHFQNMELTQNLRPDVKPKFQKPCAFFMTPAGCRRGPDCPFQHDTSFQWQTGNVVRGPSAKRMRFGGEIEGR